MDGIVSENGEQMKQNGEKYAKRAMAYIKENQLDIIPDNF
jgi:hypothetical protein